MAVWNIIEGPTNPPGNDTSDPVAGGHRIHSLLDGRQCVSVMGGAANIGAQIQL